MGVVQGWSVKLRVWSRAGVSECGCGQALEDKTKSIIQEWRITQLVWPRTEKTD